MTRALAAVVFCIIGAIAMTRLWPFLSRQGGEMSLTIDALCARSRYRRRTSHAAPARSHLPRLGPLCATLFPAGLGPRASLALSTVRKNYAASFAGCGVPNLAISFVFVYVH